MKQKNVWWHGWTNRWHMTGDNLTVCFLFVVCQHSTDPSSSKLVAFVWFFYSSAFLWPTMSSFAQWFRNHFIYFTLLSNTPHELTTNYKWCVHIPITMLVSLSHISQLKCSHISCSQLLNRLKWPWFVVIWWQLNLIMM